MELQLGLALPSSDGCVQVQQQQQQHRRHGLDLDLNVNEFGHGGCDETMVEAVGSNRFDPGSSCYSRSEEECEYERGNYERSVPRTLPLLFGTTASTITTSQAIRVHVPERDNGFVEKY